MEVFDQPYHGPTRIRHGGADIWEVEEIWHKRPLSDMTTDKALIASLPQWMFPDFIDAHWNFDIVTRCWIVIVDGRVIVVDPCTGNGRNFPDFEPAHMLDTPFIERFAATGFRPEDVDFVFCTHLHMDHCGWNTVLRDGRYVPTFPNARYVMVKREIDRWDPRHPDHVPVPQNVGTFENSVLPVIEAGLAQIVADRHTILPGVDVEPANGHTLGHSMLHVCSEEKHAYFVGDAFHHPLEMLLPGLDDQTSENFEMLHAARRNIIDTALKQDALVIPAHFCCAFGGHLRQCENGLVFEAYRDILAASNA
ncbi:MAG: MBL fold metallo-hydrolase [Novosphingobium sp.]|nr:MBL fold metallo-hydrolase [Novosphingobium sp.]